MRKTEISRRTMLRSTLAKGLGAATIGLPLLEEMCGSTLLASPVANAAAAKVPVRAFNVFFGLGIPKPIQTEGLGGVLEPLKPLRDRLLILRNVDQVRCDESGINAHFDGASGAFTAEPPNGEARAGGPSIDQVIRRAHYPKGQPDGIVPTLVGGTFFRRSRVSRYVHSYNIDGTVAATMQERPRDLFDRVFGAVSLTGDSSDARRSRLKRSVLDSVVDQYRFFTGPNSPLGSASKSRVRDHLERIRELEQRAHQLKSAKKGGPALPPRSNVAHGGAADPGGQGIDMKLDDLTTEWRLLADLYALAIQMDRVRFGSLTFLAAGERLRMTGDYKYDGRLIYTFNDAKDLNASGDQGCSHEFWHQYGEKKKNTQLRAHAHMKMREVAYFLKRLDETKEANGKTILENSLITISTESGDGRHSNVKRELSGVFHAITSANGRFKTGQFLEANREGVHLYNTMLDAVCEGLPGGPHRMGPKDLEHQAADSIRA